MRVVQLLPTLSYGDAVGNDTIALHNLLIDMGYKASIYAKNIGKRVPDGIAGRADRMPALKKEDILMYHLSTGTDLNDKLPELSGRKVMIYHNITPEHFFIPYSSQSANLTRRGRTAIGRLRSVFAYCLADSDYNRQELVQAGYQCPIDVLPILIPFEDYEKTPDAKTISRYADDWTNILFVGRIAPNKKQEDIIRTFAYYKIYVNPKSRLFLVGAYEGMERYYHRLTAYAEALGIQDVIFPGHIKFEEILAYYRLADVFLCMSEHEGFCVPLVEAMYFDLPVVAYDSCAVPGTLAGSGLLFRDKNPAETALLIDRLMKDDTLRREVINGQRRRLEDFAFDRVASQFKQCFHTFAER